MKRLLILCLLLLCIVPLASAASWVYLGSNVSQYSGSSSNPNLGPLASDAILSTEWEGTTGIAPEFLQWEPMPGTYYSKILFRNGRATSPYYDANGVCFQALIGTYVNVSLSGSGPVKFTYHGTNSTCSNYDIWGGGIAEVLYENGTPPPPIANFTAAPLNATAPVYVAFTDTSQNEYGTCTYNWSYSPLTGVFPSNLSTENTDMYFTVTGDYTISHGVSCGAGSNTSTKTDYIHILNATGATSTCFAAIDALSGYQLSGANFQMYDIENASWTNKTASSTGSECITTLSGHTINAYTDMLGYDDGELLASAARASPDYPILMFPANATNVSAGNVTLYVTVRDMYSPGLPISGAQVDMTYNFPATEQKITGASGMVSFVVPNQTTIYLAAQKSGYSGKSITVDSGNGNGGDASISTTIYLPLLTVTPTITATTLPGGGTPAPTLTYLANCDPSASDYDAAKCRASHGNSGLNILAENLDILVWICIIVTIMYLLGIRLGG